MTRILVTGSTEGLGYATADALLERGHDVVVHARNAGRVQAVRPLLKRGAHVVTADFARPDEVVDVAAQLGEDGPLDAVIHNAGIISGPSVIPVNVVAPYLLTAGLHGVRRHIYLSSEMHKGGRTSPDRIDWTGERVTGTYSDSKLFVTAISAAIADRWPNVLSNSVDPGWVPTRMGGASAPDDFALGHDTQEWLATSDDAEARTSGGYWHHRRRQQPHPAVHDARFQEQLLDALAAATGTELPSRE
jgi:NAD(P)-dependent dehydrogenase (short-subunit alcohol dehydrogenase family)